MSYQAASGASADGQRFLGSRGKRVPVATAMESAEAPKP